jgi:hypothetical protein
LPVSLHQALEITIRERYKDNLDESESIRSLEKQTWLRWLFFVVGALGPSIKLMSLQGVPWTKAWGAMFLFAFLVSEASALFHRRSFVALVMSHLPGIATALEVAELRVAQRFETLERWIFYAGTAFHSAILLWDFFYLWDPSAPPPGPAPDSTISPGDVPFAVLEISWFLIGSVMLFSPFAVLLFFYFTFSEFWSDYREGRLERSWGYLCVIISMMFFMLGLEAGFCWFVIDYHIWMKNCAFFSLSLLSVPAFVFAVKRLCGLSPKLGETLMVVQDESAQSVDGTAIKALTLCITTVTICVLWYWLGYNPEGTVNPSWVGVFG